MSKKMSTTLETAAQSSEIMTRMLVTIYGPGETFRFVANADTDLIMPDETVYTAAEIKRGDISSSTDGDKEQVQLTMSNKWQQWASYLAANGKKLKGCRCVIDDVFLDHLDEGYVWRFEGILDNLSMTISDFSCKVVRDVVDYDQEGPAMDFGPTCQFTYGDDRCQCTNINGPCDQTITTCETLGNIERFGGHPSVPMEMVIRK